MLRALFMTVAAAAVVAALSIDDVAANPNGVPVASPAPLVCTTSLSNWRVTAAPAASGEFPVPTDCSLAANSGKQCFLYQYSFQRLTPPLNASADHFLVAVAGDQDLDSASPNGFFVTPPGTSSGDNVTGFLAFAQHEYPIRLNPTPAVPAKIIVVGPSAARMSTILIKRGNTSESCLIAGPGILGDRFETVQAVQQVEVAGGKCVANITRDSFNNILNISIDTSASAPGCQTSNDAGNLGGDGKRKTPLVNGEALQNNQSITYGDNTTTCYGPRNPTPAWCICTKTPCP